ncbi:MAG TPA: Asp-tRNA(Asn)/Glu-tRNA(Gln) amidotransferase subunit GatC [bacterium]|nr:Asp-tRNA(Asn)/Glu-tRNA(Gln) amidotransferase subunit GatC [bacterium]
MADITLDTVRHVARLSRLELTDAEAAGYQRTLGDILAYIGKLNQLDTTGIEPLATVLPLQNVMREDAARPSLPADAALANAPDRSGDFYRVPRIIE